MIYLIGFTFIRSWQRQLYTSIQKLLRIKGKDTHLDINNLGEISYGEMFEKDPLPELDYNTTDAYGSHIPTVLAANDTENSTIEQDPPDNQQENTDSLFHHSEYSQYQSNDTEKQITSQEHITGDSVQLLPQNESKSNAMHLEQELSVEDDTALNCTTKSDKTDSRSTTVTLSIFVVIRASFFICPLWFLANVFFNYSLSLTSVSSNTILSTTSSLFTFLLGLVFLRKSENFSATRFSACVGTLIGVFIIAYSDEKSGEGLLGDAFALISAVFYACYSVSIKRFLPENSASMPMFFGKVLVTTLVIIILVFIKLTVANYHSFVFTNNATGFLGLFNFIILFPGLLLLNYIHIPGINGDRPFETFSLPSFKQFFSLAINGLIGTVLSDMLWAKSVQLTSPVVSTIGLSLTIPLAIISDLVIQLIKEISDWVQIVTSTFSVWYILGSLIVVLSFTCANLSYQFGTKLKSYDSLQVCYEFAKSKLFHPAKSESNLLDMRTS